MQIQVIISIFFFALGILNLTSRFLPVQKAQEHKVIAAAKKENEPEEKEIRLPDDSDSVDYNIISYSQKLIAVIPTPTPKPKFGSILASNTSNRNSSFSFTANSTPTPKPFQRFSIPIPVQTPRKEEHHEEHHDRENHGREHHHRN